MEVTTITSAEFSVDSIYRTISKMPIENFMILWIYIGVNDRKKIYFYQDRDSAKSCKDWYVTCVEIMDDSKTIQSLAQDIYTYFDSSNLI